jgi:hypothetical protein
MEAHGSAQAEPDVTAEVGRTEHYANRSFTAPALTLE